MIETFTSTYKTLCYNQPASLREPAFSLRFKLLHGGGWRDRKKEGIVRVILGWSSVSNSASSLYLRSGFRLASLISAICYITFALDENYAIFSNICRLYLQYSCIIIDSRTKYFSLKKNCSLTVPHPCEWFQIFWYSQIF